MLSEIQMSGEWQTFCLLLIYLKHSTEQNGLNWTAHVCCCLLLIYLKHSTEQNGHFIKLWNLKWKGVDRNRPLKWVLIEQLMSADTADKILSSDWLVNLKLCSDWLDKPFKRRISKVETDWPDRLLNCLLSQLKRTIFKRTLCSYFKIAVAPTFCS